ncbi:MAG: AzlD domain-containing protein [Minwuiales bacterium]|nr:AzlD domain-containing protein [Minwuiales bacterium]
MNAAAESWTVVLLAIAATYVWRFAGVLFSARIDPDGALFRWVSCVSYAMLAGLCARMIVLPLGGLGETLLVDRLIAIALAFGLFFLWGRRTLPAVALGVGSFVAFAWARSAGLLG